MFTAHEARELAKQHDITINKYLTRIEKKIKEFATLGKYEITLAEALSEWNGITQIYGKEGKLSASQKRLGDKLLESGYSMVIKSHDYDRNECLGSMTDPNDPPDMDTSHTICIQW